MQTAQRMPRHLSEIWMQAQHVSICVEGGERAVIGEGRDGYRVVVVAFAVHSDGEASVLFEDAKGRSLHGQPFKLREGEQFRGTWNPHGHFALPEGQDLVLESRGHGSTVSGFVTYLLAQE